MGWLLISSLERMNTCLLRVLVTAIPTPVKLRVMGQGITTKLFRIRQRLTVLSFLTVRLTKLAMPKLHCQRKWKSINTLHPMNGSQPKIRGSGRSQYQVIIVLLMSIWNLLVLLRLQTIKSRFINRLLPSTNLSLLSSSSLSRLSQVPTLQASQGLIRVSSRKNLGQHKGRNRASPQAITRAIKPIILEWQSNIPLIWMCPWNLLILLLWRPWLSPSKQMLKIYGKEPETSGLLWWVILNEIWCIF